MKVLTNTVSVRIRQVLGAGLCSLVFAANGAQVTTPPAPGTPKNFTLPATQTVYLSNGLGVTFIPYGNTPKTTISLQLLTGNQDDGDQKGLSDMVFALLTQGTDTLSATDIAQQAASMGGQVRTSVSMNDSFVSMDVLSEFGSDAAQLIAQLMTRSNFDSDELDKAIAHHWREIEVSRSQAQGQALEAFYHLMYGDHPYGVTYPTQSQLTSISRDDVVAFANSHFVAKQAHLYVAGVFDQSALLASIEAAFSSLPQGESAEPLVLPPVLTTPELVQIDRENAPQSTVRLGQPTIAMDNEDYVPMEVMNALLGGMFSSRITRNIREDKGYTYSPRSAVFSYKDRSVWFESADIQAESTGEAINEIVKEIKGLQAVEPSQKELQGVKNYMSGIFVLRNSSRQGVINQLSDLAVNGLPKTRLTDYISNVNKVTAKQVSDVAKTYLNLDNMSLIVVGDDEQMQSELGSVENLPVISQLK